MSRSAAPVGSEGGIRSVEVLVLQCITEFFGKSAPPQEVLKSLWGLLIGRNFSGTIPLRLRYAGESGNRASW